MKDEHLYIERESVSNHQQHSHIAHWHDSLELIYVEKGSMNCQTDKEVFPLYKGDLCFINRSHTHQLFCDVNQKSQHLVLVIGQEWVCAYPEIRDKYIKPMLEDPLFSHIRFDPEDEHNQVIVSCMKDILSLKEEGNCAYELIVAGLVHKIYHALYCAYTSQSDHRNKIDENRVLLQKMMEYIQDHYEQSVSLDDIASTGMVSKAKCSRLFQQYTRQSPIAYLNSYRLQQAASLLRNTTRTIADISFSCGFGQQSYFNRMFLREYECTPKEYRKEKN